MMVKRSSISAIFLGFEPMSVCFYMVADELQACWSSSIERGRGEAAELAIGFFCRVFSFVDRRGK
jgi:hypothetical protein